MTQSSAISDILLELNEAEVIMTKNGQTGFNYVSSTFADTLSWGQQFIADIDLFQGIAQLAGPEHYTAGATEKSVRSGIDELHTSIASRLDKLQQSVDEIQGKQQESSYLELVRAAKEQPDLPVPFASIEAAESFLSGSSDNMDLAKTFFSSRQETLESRSRNNKRKKAVLPSCDLWRFLFTNEVLDTLVEFDKYR